MCAAYLLASTAVEVLSNPFPRDQLSSAFYSTLATFSRWMVNRCVLLTCAFTKITRSRVHDVLSNSQRLLRQAHASHRCIEPVMASVWVFANPPAGSSGQDALGLITIYTRPDEFSVKFTEPFPPLSICSKYPLPHQRKFHQKPY